MRTSVHAGLCANEAEGSKQSLLKDLRETSIWFVFSGSAILGLRDRLRPALGFLFSSRLAYPIPTCMRIAAPPSCVLNWLV